MRWHREHSNSYLFISNFRNTLARWTGSARAALENFWCIMVLLYSRTARMNTEICVFQHEYEIMCPKHRKEGKSSNSWTMTQSVRKNKKKHNYDRIWFSIDWQYSANYVYFGRLRIVGITRRHYLYSRRYKWGSITGFPRSGANERQIACEFKPIDKGIRVRLINAPA